MQPVIFLKRYFLFWNYIAIVAFQYLKESGHLQDSDQKEIYIVKYKFSKFED